MRGNRLHGGFTLVEVIVALAVSGILIISAYSIASVLGDHAITLAATATSGDRAANADRLLRELATQVDIGSAADEGFGGNEREASFTSWCTRPAGWAERCDVILSVDTTAGSRSILLTRAREFPIVVRAGFANAELRYLRSADDGGQWFRVWGKGITIPLAIGVIVDADTTIIRLGERG